MSKPDLPETAVPTVHFNGRTWTPRTSLDFEVMQHHERDPLNRCYDGQRLQKIAETHAEYTMGECGDLIDSLVLDLAFPTLCTAVPPVRKQLVETLAAVQSLKAMLLYYRDAGNRAENTTCDRDLVEGLAAIEMQRLQKENAELETECAELHREYMEIHAKLRKPEPPAKKKHCRAAPKKPAKPHAPKPIPKPLFERMTASVNGNGFHANGKHN